MKCHTLFLLFLFGISASLASADEDSLTVTPNSTDDSDPDQAENVDKVYKTSASEDVPEPIGIPKPINPKPHHHRQKDQLENVHSHRSPVYEVVSQPCYSYGCRGYGQEAGYQPWQSRGNRFVPYPQTGYEQRRKGPYPPPEYYPDGGYYGPREPDYGYGPRARPIYPQSQGRYGGYGEYSQPNFGSRFLG